MEKLKKWLDPTKNKIIAGVISVLVLAGGGYGVWSVTQQNNVEYPEIRIKDNIQFEYGQSIEKEQYGLKQITFDDIIAGGSKYDTAEFKLLNSQTKKPNEELEIIDTMKLGDGYANFSASYKGIYSQGGFPYTVVDTQSPIIEGAVDMETAYGSDLKFEDIITGTDLVDGKVKLIVEGEFDTSKAGQYEMKAIATDNNGNVTEKTFIVTVHEEEKPVEEPETPSSQAPSNTGGTSSTSKPSSNTGNTSTTKPAEPSKPAETPKPTEPTKPVEKPKPAEPEKPVPEGMKLFKKYDSAELCIADMDNQSRIHVREWIRNRCSSDGRMLYEPR